MQIRGDNSRARRPDQGKIISQARDISYICLADNIILKNEVTLTTS